MKQVRAKIQAHLMKGEVEESLTSLLTMLAETDQRRAQDSALMLKAQWEGAKQEQIRGMLSRPEYEQAVNKVINGIQLLVNDLDDDAQIAASANTQDSGNLTRILLIGGLLLAVILGAGYYFLQSGTKSAVSTPQQKTSPADTPTQAEKTESAKQTPAAPPVNQPSPKVTTPKSEQPAAATKSVSTAAPQPAPAMVETKMIVTSSDVDIKIDGRSPNYSGIATGIVRTIRIQEGQHKFEIVENGVACTTAIMITQSTSKIYPTCK